MRMVKGIGVRGMRTERLGLWEKSKVHGLKSKVREREPAKAGE